MILAFISHSSRDEVVAAALARLLERGVGLGRHEIRCSSAAGYMLPAGVNFDDVLRSEVGAAPAFIALVTPASVKSAYVLFELGARWGARLPVVPVLASGTTINDLPGPLERFVAATAYEDVQIHRLVNDVADQVGRAVQPANAYVHELRELLKCGAKSLPADVSPGDVSSIDPPTQTGVSVDALRTLCAVTARDEYDIYARHEIPPRFLEHARRKNGYVSRGDRVLALVSNSGECQDGLAILESGISWRNMHTEPCVRLTWAQLQDVRIRDDGSGGICIGPNLCIDLSGGHADSAVVAKLLRRLVDMTKVPRSCGSIEGASVGQLLARGERTAAPAKV